MYINSKGNLRMIGTKHRISYSVIVMVVMVIVLLTVLVMLKPVYDVTISGSHIGYINQKSEFVELIDNFLTQENDEIAYIDMQEQPEYTFTVVSRAEPIDNEKVYNDVIATAYVYQKVYSIFADNQEVALVSYENDANELLSELKKIKTTADFSIAEGNLINPQVITKDELITLINTDYKVNVKNSVLSSAKNVSKIIDVGFSFETPLRGVITSRYGYRSSGMHTGIDIANKYDTPIYAAADGTVIYSGIKGTYGNTVIIQHDNDVVTYYAHCNKLLVEKGDIVEQGMQIATIGMTGNTTGPHLHFEVRVNGHDVDPSKYVGNIGK